MRGAIPKLKKLIYVSKTGYRSVSSGGPYFSDTNEAPDEVIDVSNATDDEFNQLKANPNKKSLIDKLTRKKK